MNKYLSVHSHIMLNLLFGSAANKIINNREEDLDEIEKESVMSLKVNVHDRNESDTGNNLTKYERMQANRRKIDHSSSAYINCKSIPATSCPLERSFSAEKLILAVLRKHMKQVLFEALLFLKFNRRMWDIKSVASAMKLNCNE